MNSGLGSGIDLYISRVTFLEIEDKPIFEEEKDNAFIVGLVNTKSSYRITITFESVETYRITNESFITTGGYDFSGVSIREEILYKSKDSEYLKWLRKISGEAYEQILNESTHYLICGEESLIEVISQYQPVIKVLKTGKDDEN
jgi:hypothetical protein